MSRRSFTDKIILNRGHEPVKLIGGRVESTIRTCDDYHYGLVKYTHKERRSAQSNIPFISIMIEFLIAQFSISIHKIFANNEI